MLRNDLPPLMILLCACGFFLVALFYPWLSARFGLERARPERRVLGFLLGTVLMLLWLIWRANKDI